MKHVMGFVLALAVSTLASAPAAAATSCTCADGQDAKGCWLVCYNQETLPLAVRPWPTTPGHYYHVRTEALQPYDPADIDSAPDPVLVVLDGPSGRVLGYADGNGVAVQTGAGGSAGTEPEASLVVRAASAETVFVVASYAEGAEGRADLALRTAPPTACTAAHGACLDEADWETQPTTLLPGILFGAWMLDGYGTTPGDELYLGALPEPGEADAPAQNRLLVLERADALFAQAAGLCVDEEAQCLALGGTGAECALESCGDFVLGDQIGGLSRAVVAADWPQASIIVGAGIPQAVTTRLMRSRLGTADDPDGDGLTAELEHLDLPDKHFNLGSCDAGPPPPLPAHQFHCGGDTIGPGDASHGSSWVGDPADSDSDGLNDLWEVFGVRLTCAGDAPPPFDVLAPCEDTTRDADPVPGVAYELPLSARGTDPAEVDVFLQLDSIIPVGGGDTSLTPEQEALVRHVYEEEGLECPWVESTDDAHCPGMLEEHYRIALHIDQEHAIPSAWGAFHSASETPELLRSHVLTRMSAPRRALGVHRYGLADDGSVAGPANVGRAHARRLLYVNNSQQSAVGALSLAHEIGHLLGLAHHSMQSTVESTSCSPLASLCDGTISEGPETLQTWWQAPNYGSLMNHGSYGAFVHARKKSSGGAVELATSWPDDFRASCVADADCELEDCRSDPGCFGEGCLDKRCGLGRSPATRRFSRGTLPDISESAVMEKMPIAEGHALAAGLQGGVFATAPPTAPAGSPLAAVLACCRTSNVAANCNLNALGEPIPGECGFNFDGAPSGIATLELEPYCLNLNHGHEATASEVAVAQGEEGCIVEEDAASCDGASPPQDIWRDQNDWTVMYVQASAELGQPWLTDARIYANPCEPQAGSSLLDGTDVSGLGTPATVSGSVQALVNPSFAAGSSTWVAEFDGAGSDDGITIGPGLAFDSMTQQIGTRAPRGWRVQLAFRQSGENDNGGLSQVLLSAEVFRLELGPPYVCDSGICQVLTAFYDTGVPSTPDVGSWLEQSLVLGPGTPKGASTAWTHVVGIGASYAEPDGVGRFYVYNDTSYLETRVHVVEVAGAVPVPAAGPLVVGADPAQPARTYHGWLDDIQVFNYWSTAALRHATRLTTDAAAMECTP